jgi:hypothetical protein
VALTTTVTVHGLAELDALLRKLPEDVAGDIMREGLEAGANVIRTATAANIHSRTGRLAKGLRVVVQVHPEENSGVAAVGADPKQNYKLRFIEFGARGKKSGGRGWDMQGGAEDARLARKAARALRASGNAAGAAALRASVKSGDVTTRHALKLPGNIFRAKAHHPGFAGYSPLTRGLAESARGAIEAFKAVLERRLRGITRTRLGQ